MRKRLGEVLIDAGLISEKDLENALNLQKGKNKRLGKILIELGFVNEQQIAEALSKQLSLPLVDCNDYNIPKEVASLIPKETAEKKIILPLEKQDKRLLVAMADPLDWQTIDEIAFNTGLKLTVAIAPESNILGAIERVYGSEEKTWNLLKEIPSYDGVEILKEEKPDEQQEVNIRSLYKMSEAPPIVKLVTMLLVDAVKSCASDIHIEPHENFVQVRYRIDGQLKNILKYPKHIQDSVISRIKIISNLDITNRRLPQDGRSSLRLEDKKIDLRISTLPSVYGEKIVIRLLDPTTGLIPLKGLGMPEILLDPLMKIAKQPQGMLLVTGPTGSGKTTTLYALLQKIRTETKNIITIEDPVEYKLQGITQVGVNDAIGLTFANTLRSVLRQDPDVIMVGEIRDLETAEIAARSALTGHFVLSTVHTNDTTSTITRLIDIGLPPYLVTSAVTAVLAQRLIRKICPHCKEETDPPEDVDRYGFPPLEKYYHGKGCKECHYTGYKGRIGVYELLRMSTPMKRLIARNFTEDELLQVAREEGTKTLFEDAWEKVAAGITTVEEILSKVPFQKETLSVSEPLNGQDEERKVLL
ncbi:MAG: type II secretion system protein GspE, partial [Nitrospirae bacterium]